MLARYEIREDNSQSLLIVQINRNGLLLFVPVRLSENMLYSREMNF